MRKQREKLQNRLSPTTGSNIRKYRQQLNMSCTELARVVGISPSFLSCLELGKRKGTNYTILKSIADTLGVLTEDLTGESAPVIPSADEQRYRLLQILERIAVSEELSHEETLRQMELVLEISKNILE